RRQHGGRHRGEGQAPRPPPRRHARRPRLQPDEEARLADGRPLGRGQGPQAPRQARAPLRPPPARLRRVHHPRGDGVRRPRASRLDVPPRQGVLPGEEGHPVLRRPHRPDEPGRREGRRLRPQRRARDRRAARLAARSGPGTLQSGQRPAPAGCPGCRRPHPGRPRLGADVDQRRQQDRDRAGVDDRHLGRARREHVGVDRHALSHRRARHRERAAPAERLLLALARPLPLGPRLPRLRRPSRPDARHRPRHVRPLMRTMMMKTTLRTMWTALQLALLAAASVLATELIYAHAVLDSPVRLEASIVGLYAAVFAVTGLAAGVASAVLRRPGAASLLVGAGLTFLVLALRLHYRLTVRSAVASTRLVAVSWFVPLAIVAASALGGPSRSAEGAVARPTIARPDAPPIIWVTIDTLRADHLSVYGYPVRTTPRL